MQPGGEPYDCSLLSVADGSQLYWEASGNPGGRPAIYLHGGPGGRLSTGYRRRFDPEHWRIIGLDQRGSGRSRPLASEDLDQIQQAWPGSELIMVDEGHGGATMMDLTTRAIARLGDAA